MSGNGNEPGGSSSQNQNNSQDQTKSMFNRKWKLKDAQIKVIDIFAKTTSKLSPLVIKLEVKLLRATGDVTKFVVE